MKDHTTTLSKFNISPTASKVYIALLELGKSSADKIAKKVGTYKSNVYDALERLMEIGLVSYIFEGKKKLYLATNPEKIALTIEEQKQKSIERYEELKNEVEKIMPELLAKFHSSKEKDVFEIYKGKKGYRAMIQDILREKPKCWKGFGNLQVYEFFPYDCPKWFKDVKFMLFSTKSNVVLKRLKFATKSTNVKIKWLPKDLYMPIVWTLFGENLLILIYEPDIIALRIKSKQIVNTFSNQFHYLWEKV
ncbi:MAG: helix-turn-helix domain-containing protein [Nanoarchaeota archaeon]